MTFSEQARRTYERFKPAADAATAARETFMRLHADSGLPAAHLQFIYNQQRAWSRRGKLRQEVEAGYGIAPFVDDGERDLAWAYDHPRREFRVRPWRPSDGEPVLHTVPCVTVIHLFSGEALVGIPHSFIERSGFPHVSPRDDDDYGLLLFLVQRASNNWRDKMPELAA